MAGEELTEGEWTYVVSIDEARKLVVGKKATVKDARGDPVLGRVKSVREGNRMALVIMEGSNA